MRYMVFWFGVSLGPASTALGTSAGSITQDEIVSPSASFPTSTGFSRLAIMSPPGPSFLNSTSTMIASKALRLTDSCASTAPLRAVDPLGRDPSIPQWWTIATAQLEGLSDGIRSRDIGCHVSGVVFRASQRAIQRVEND